MGASDGEDRQGPHEFPKDLLQLDDALPQVRIDRLEDLQLSPGSRFASPQHQGLAGLRLQTNHEGERSPAECRRLLQSGAN